MTALLFSGTAVTGALPRELDMPQLVALAVSDTTMEQWSNASLRNSRGEALPEWCAA